MKHAEKPSPMDEVLRVMARLRSPKGCPWDLEQTHQSLRLHAIEEVYELIDAIEARDDHEMAEELGDLLLQVVFHCQLAKERRAFDFNEVCRALSHKLIRRHPHVFGNSQARTVAAVWTQWEKIKRQEKSGTRHHRASALDGIPRHLPALLHAEKLVKKARKAGLSAAALSASRVIRRGSGNRRQLAQSLFDLVSTAQIRGWCAEDLLRQEIRRQARHLRRAEIARNRLATAKPRRQT